MEMAAAVDWPVTAPAEETAVVALSAPEAMAVAGAMAVPAVAVKMPDGPAREPACP